ncbi:MAG: hypothetical protein Kow0032_20600 [Methyloligellaceae bacterium]
MNRVEFPVREGPRQIDAVDFRPQRAGDGPHFNFCDAHRFPPERSKALSITAAGKCAAYDRKTQICTGPNHVCAPVAALPPPCGHAIKTKRQGRGQTMRGSGTGGSPRYMWEMVTCRMQ